MSSMYAYPRVAHCDPQHIPLPHCMYRMCPIGLNEAATTVTSSGSDSGGDDPTLRSLVSAQERLLNRLHNVEEGLRKLGVYETNPHKEEASENTGRRKSPTPQTPEAPAPGQEAITSILQRQEKLIQQIDRLSTSLEASVVVSAAKPLDSSITRQKATDVAIFVEIGFSIPKLYSFFTWLRMEQKWTVQLTTHFHSSSVGLSPRADWKDFDCPGVDRRTGYDLTISVIVRKAPGISSFIDPSHGLVVGEEEIIEVIANKLAVNYKR